MILSADEQATNPQYTVEDGTDSIMVKMRIDSDADETMAERRAVEGGQVRPAVGQLRAFNQVKNVVAYHISLITDFNEYLPLHRGRPPTPRPRRAPSPTSPPAAAPRWRPSSRERRRRRGADGGGGQPVGGKDINQTVLEYFQSCAAQFWRAIGGALGARGPPRTRPAPLPPSGTAP